MSIYDDLQKLAGSVVRPFDQGGVQYVVMIPGDGPADNPGEPTPQPFPVAAVARGVKFKYLGGSLVGGGTIVSSDMQATIPVDDRFEPNLDGFVIVNGERYKVIRVDAIPAAGVPVVNRVFFRK